MKYKVGDRVAYMTHKLLCFGHIHKVGYIKQVRKSLFGTRYVICVAKSDEVNVVLKRNIFSKVERKDKAEEQTDREYNHRQRLCN